MKDFLVQENSINNINDPELKTDPELIVDIEKSQKRGLSRKSEVSTMDSGYRDFAIWIEGIQF